MKRRWIEFRHDLLAQTPVERRCEDVDSADEPGETVLLRIGDRVIRLDEYLAVFGIAEPRRFNSVKRANCSQMTLVYAAAGLVERLGITPEQAEDKVDITAELILAGMRIAEVLAADILPGATVDVAAVRDLQAYPTIERAREAFFEVSPPPGEEEGRGEGEVSLSVDWDFFATVRWDLKRELAPQHSIHL